MGKQNIRYYEDLYLDCLRAYLKAKTKDDKLKALKLIEEFKEHGNRDFKEVKASDATDEEYHKYRNMCNYKRVASKIPTIDKDKYNDDIARAEIKRIKKERAKRITKKTLYVVAAGALVAIIGSGVSCSKKKSNSTSSTSETTTETTQETTSETTTYGTDPTTTTAGTPTFSSKDNNGITIIDPTTSQTNGDETYGGSYVGSNNGSNSDDNYGSSNGGSSSSSSETEGTTKPTEGTTTTTSTTTVETTTNPSVPTTEPVVTVNTEPADERNQRDVVVDVHDGKNPEYIEEDDNESYETFIDVPTTTTVTTTSGTVNGMPIEEDEDEEYETFFYIENMKKSNAKTLTLRK